MGLPKRTPLAFADRADGRFDIYSAGGLGNNPRFGVKVGEGVEPARILYYIKAMWLTFRAYGNYENRGKARTRYMQEVLGGPKAYAGAYREKLEEVFASGERLDLELPPEPGRKDRGWNGCGGDAGASQKQPGLYTVVWHPIGGSALCGVVLCAQ